MNFNNLLPILTLAVNCSFLNKDKVTRDLSTIYARQEALKIMDNEEKIFGFIELLKRLDNVAALTKYPSLN